MNDTLLTKVNFSSLVSLAKENQIFLEAFLESLNKGFLLVKQTQMEKTGKNSITAGDCLIQFFNYSGKNKENFNSLYHLSLVFLYHKKQQLGEDSYNKLLKYSKDLYQKKGESL